MDAEHRGGGGRDDVVLRQLERPVLVGAVGAHGPRADVEVAVGDGGRVVDGDRERVAEPVGVLLDGLHEGGGGDAAEGPDHVRVLRPGPAPDAAVGCGGQGDGRVERVRRSVDIDHAVSSEQDGGSGAGRFYV
nr:hypothetical protein GCM10020093_022780 [Planobispora longispora]